MHGLKREIDAIINHEIRDGRPSFFFSASCAEYYWRPLLEHLSEYIGKCEARVGYDLLGKDNKELYNKLQEYAHVVTLFYEERATKWVEDVLVPALDLKCFYMVFEFAKSRGQIHFHLIAWRRDAQPHLLMHTPVPACLAESVESGSPPDVAALTTAWAEAWSGVKMFADESCNTCEVPEKVPDALLKGGADAVKAWRAELLAAWMKKLNFSAHHPAQQHGAAFDDTRKWPAPEGSMPAPSRNAADAPISVYRMETENVAAHMRDVVNFCKIHRCSNYCLRHLRHPTPEMKGQRECSKGGFGPEAPRTTKGGGQVPRGIQ